MTSSDAARVRTAAVILHYRRWPTVIETIEAVQLQLPDEAIVIVDNASDDGSFERLRETFPALRVLAAPGNNGYAAGMNVGISAFVEQGADNIVLLTHECILGPSAINQLEDALADPAVGLAAPLLGYRSRPDVVWSAGGGFSKRGRPFHLGAGSQFVVSTDRPYGVKWVDGAALFVRSKALAEIGGLDERYFMYLEDVDLALDLAEGGWRVVLVPGARAWQESSGTPPYLDARNRILLWRKHRRWGSLLATAFDLAERMLRDLRHGAHGRSVARARFAGTVDGLTGRVNRSLAMRR